MYSRNYIIAKSTQIVYENQYLIYENFDLRHAISKYTEPVTSALEQVFSNVIETFQNEKDRQAIVHEYKQQQKRILQYLKSQGISEAKIKKIIEDVKKNDFHEIDKIFDVKFILSEFKEELKHIRAKDVLILVIILISMIFFELLFQSILTQLLGPIAAAFLTAVISAPLVEEAFKRASVKNFKSFSLVVPFAAIEGLSYIALVITLGGSVWIMFIARLLAFMMHMVTLFFHKKGQIQANLASAFTNDKEIPQKIKARATVSAQLIHAFWNSVVNALYTLGHGAIGVASASILAKHFHKPI